MNLRPLWLPSILTLLCLAGTSRAAESDPGSSTGILPVLPIHGLEARATQGLRFIRAYAPAGRIQDWPLGDVKYVPMARDEFERLLAIAQTTASGDGRPLLGVAAARYRARLAGDRLVDGTAALEVVSAAAGKALLPLDPCGLAIRNPRWAGAEEEPATLGLDEKGRLAVVVQGDGRLQWDWSLRGQREAGGAIRFALELPSSPVTQLLLDLPRGIRPVTARGLVRPAGKDEGDVRQWQIELGGNRRGELRLVPDEVPKMYQRLVLLRQSLVYDFTLYGVDVSAHLQLDVHNEPLERAAFVLGQGLQLVTARYGNTDLRWSVRPHGDGKTTLAVLEFPEAIQGPGRILRLGARVPLRIGRPWRLPTIRMENASWQEGSATLLIPKPLLLEQLVPIRCRQSKTEPLPTPRLGESAEFQHFAPDATAEILLTRPETPLLLDCGAAIELSERDVTGLVRASFRAGQGEHFLLEADVARRWLIDSVESVPAEAIEDWNLETKAGGPGRLSIRLARPITPTRPVRLEISGRRLHSPLGRRLRRDNLVPLRFRVGPGGKRLVAVRTSGLSYQIELTDVEKLTRVDPRTLDRAEMELFRETPRGLLFQDDAGADRMQLSLKARQPGYSATIRAEAMVSGDWLTESYWVSCVPEMTRVDRVLIQFSHPRDAPVRWTLGAEDDRQLTARRLPEPSGADAPAGVEAERWEINVRPPRSGQFEIRGVRVTARTNRGKDGISLIRLPEATTQQATLVVRCEGPTPLKITNNRLSPVPPQSVPPDRYPTARATYRYNPNQDAVPRPEAAVTVDTPQAEQDAPSAFAWSCRFQSRYEAEGLGRHLAVYRLQNSGRERIEVTLPPGVGPMEAVGLWVDGVLRRLRPVGQRDPERLVIDLPPGRKFPTVAIGFSTVGVHLGALRAIEPPLPEIDVPVLGRHWTVWLPPGYRAVAPKLPASCGGGPPATGSQRLLGPLGRAPGEGPFDPTVTEDWYVAAGYHPRRESVRRAIDRVLAAIGSLETEPSGKQPTQVLDWGTRLSGIPAGKLGLGLLVDRYALARAGVAPRSPLPDVVDGEPAQRGEAMLREAGLALLVQDDVVLLTGAIDAAVYRAYLTKLEHDPVWWVLPGPLADQMREATRKPDTALVSVDGWKGASGHAALPWMAAGADGCLPADLLGWTVCRVEIPDLDVVPVRLRIVHRGRARTFLWISLLAVAALGCWTVRRRPLVLGLLASAAGATALAVPEPFVPIASGAVLGILFCFARRMVARNRPAAPSPVDTGQRAEPDASGAISRQSVVIVFLAATFAAAAAGASEQPPAGGPKAKAQPVYRVFIPVDDKGKPNGDRYQVPEVLYQHLRRCERASVQEPRGWLLTGATYRGEFSLQTPQNRLILDKLRAIFDLEALGGGSKIRIPLGREGANLLPGGVLLDGQAIEPRWEEDGRVLVFSVPEPVGSCRLELALRPTVQAVGAMASIDLDIPRLATSRLELAMPDNAPAVEVPSAARSTTTTDGKTRKLVAELSPNSRLVVQWQNQNGRSADHPAVDAEELLWLRVQPGSVVIQAKFKLQVVGGRLSEVQLSADPRLRLLPLKGESAPKVLTSRTPDKPQVIRLQFPRPVEDKVDVAVSFLLTGVSGVGSLRMPELKTLGTRTIRRWLAVSVDPALELSEPPADRPQAVAVPDFLAAWGKADTQPLLVDNATAAEPLWSMLTRPCNSRTTARQNLALSFGDRTARLRFDAALVTTAGYSFQYRLSAPDNLEVEKISVLEKGIERAARWSRGPDGQITVFLTGPVSGPQELSLEGRLPAPVRSRLALPSVAVEGVQVESSTVELFRQPEVLVRLSKTVGLREVETPSAKSVETGYGRLVKRLTVDGERAVEAMLTLAPNHPKVAAEQITSLAWNGDRWELAVDLSIQTTRGTVDELRLSVPPSWKGPYKTDPPAVLRSVDAELAGNGELVVRPHSAIEGSYRIRISGPMTLAAGQQLSVPEIVLRDVDSLDRFLVLPTQRQLAPIAWETNGLEKTPLPEGFSGPPVAPEAFASYRVVEESYRASLLPMERAVETPRVHQADIRVAWQADGTCSGVAIFDLTPAGSLHCPLELPEGYRPVQVFVAGIPVALTGEGRQTWQLPLASQRLPQRVEVIFSGQPTGLAIEGSRRFDAPRLGSWPVGHTLWTVSGPTGAGHGAPESVGQVSRLGQEMHRLRNVAALIERASELTGPQTEETTRWYRAWARRLETVRGEVRRQLALPPQTDFSRSVHAELQSIDRRQTQAAERLGVAAIAGELADGPGRVDGAGELWLRTLDRSEPASRCVVRGRCDSIVVGYPPVTADRFAARAPRAILFGAVVLLLVLGSRLRFGAILRCRWPHLLGVVAGLAWWLWLSPSIFGWVLVLLSLMACVRSVWKPWQDHHSTIIPLDPMSR